MMQDSIILTTNEVREIISKYLDIPIENIFKAKYSFVIIIDNQTKEILMSCKDFKEIGNLKEYNE